MTGIGHQRDSTILDEVAHLSCDTRSKVIAGIEHQIVRRTQEAKRHFQAVAEQTLRTAETSKAHVERPDAQVRARATATVAQARRTTDGLLASSRLAAFRNLHEAATATDRAFASVRSGTSRQLARANHLIPLLVGHVKDRAAASIATARQDSRVDLATVIERARLDVQRSKERTRGQLDQVEQEVKRTVQTARTGTESLMREISGQGPQKTLGRGFAIVQAEDGKTIASAASIEPNTAIRITFHDGAVRARVVPAQDEKPP